VSPPGGGKGTQAKKLEKAMGLPHFSSGDLLRQCVNGGTELGKSVKKIIAVGELVDNSIVKQLIKAHMINMYTSWILDGYPRKLDQAEELDELLVSSKQDITAVLLLDVPDDVIIDRNTNRLVHPASGRVYNRTFKPPLIPMVDDITGEPLVQRDDDKLETVMHRLELYHAMTKPILKYYENRKKLITIPSPDSNVGYQNILKIWDTVTLK
jgi:adenylate kinase